MSDPSKIRKLIQNRHIHPNKIAIIAEEVAEWV